MTLRQNTKITTYQIKNVAQVLFEQWRSERSLERGLVDLVKFKEDFLDCFFPLEWMEKKMLKLMNLRQGGMMCKTTHSNSPNSPSMLQA